jgi:hypothetical protein
MSQSVPVIYISIKRDGAFETIPPRDMTKNNPSVPTFYKVKIVCEKFKPSITFAVVLIAKSF